MFRDIFKKVETKQYGASIFNNVRWANSGCTQRITIIPFLIVFARLRKPLNFVGLMIPKMWAPSEH